MPTYTFECERCGTSRDEYLSFAEHDQVKSGEKKIICGNDMSGDAKPIPGYTLLRLHCSLEMKQIITSPAYGIPDLQPYYSIATGEWIDGRKKHKEMLKQNGLLEVGNERLPPRKPEPMDSPVPELRQAVRDYRRKYGYST